jgi:antitoxin component YwqK of YwqJK toxin-antitoxin module
MEKEEYISVSVGNIKRFYKAQPLAVEKKDSEGVELEGKIPNGKFKEYYSTLETLKTYKNGNVEGIITLCDLQPETEEAEAAPSVKTEDAKDPAKENEPVFTYSPSEIVFYKNGKVTARQKIDAKGAAVSAEGEPFTGLAKEFYPNGSLQREAYFENNLAQGQMKTYDKNGRLLAAENYKNGLRHGTAYRYNFKEGILSEERTEYDEGKVSGKREVYSINGKVINLETFKDEKMDGPKETFYLNGNLEFRAFYKDNLLEGERTFYYSGEQLMYKENFSKGKLEGKRTGFYPDGKTYLTENYKDGRLDGERLLYDQEGSVKSREVYKDGSLVKQ